MGINPSGPPIDYDYGRDYDYSVWTNETELEFLNVTWDAEYRDAVRMGTREDFNAWIDNRVGAKISLTEVSYVKPGLPIMIDLKHNVANRFNYIRVRNPLLPGNDDLQKDYYYFISGVEYVSPDVTAIYVQLDAWATWIYDCIFGNAYVERSHLGIANQNNFSRYGRDYLTVPEGIDTGAEMRYLTYRKETVMGVRNNNGVGEDYADVMVIATQNLRSDPGTKDAPNMETAGGADFERAVTGAGIYMFASRASFQAYLVRNAQFSWRTQSIVAAYMVPKLSRYWEFDFVGNTPFGEPVPLSTFHSLPVKHKFFPNWRDSPEILNQIPERYRHLKKFFTYPYMAIEITTWTAAPVLLKPESWGDPDAQVLERASFLPPNQRIEFVPRHYNGWKATDNIANWLDLPDDHPFIVDNPRYAEIGDDGGDYLDIVARIMNFPSTPIVSDSGITFLASNAASIQAAYKGAEWTQQRALAGNQLSFDQSSRSIAGSADQAAINQQQVDDSRKLNNQYIANSQNIRTGGGIAGGLVGATADGGWNPLALLGRGVSAIEQNVQAGNTINYNNDLTAIQLFAQNQSHFANMDQQKYMRDTNKIMADWAAKGDYAQSITALNAKVHDAAMIQPTMSGQFGGESINLSNNSVEVSVRWKMIDNAAIASIGEIWLQFGYQVNRSVAKLPDDLRVMTNFSYWKCSKVYVRSAPMPEEMRQTIRGILEKGVTVWSDPDKIGFTDFADNEPIAGITL